MTKDTYVYIVFEYTGSGEDVVGVFSNPEAAEECLNKVNKEWTVGRISAELVEHEF